MDILYLTRKNNTLIGWNNNKKVYSRKFDNLITAKMIAQWGKRYIKFYGWLTIHAIDMNIDYILEHRFNSNNY
jgi:hypothetical protein